MSDEDVIYKVPVEMPPPLPAPPPGACLHNKNVETRAALNYTSDSHHYTVDLRVKCLDCGCPFRFAALPHAILFTRPCRDLSGITATLPLVPDESLRMHLEAEPEWPV